MTYPSGGQGYPPSPQQGPPPQVPPQGPPHQGSPPTASPAGAPADGPSKLPTYLLGAVLALGLIGYLISFGPVYSDTSEYSEIRTASFPANFAVAALVLAALLAALALLPKQTSQTGLVTAIALTGFLIAVLELITNADAAGWALIMIVIIGGLQALAAIGALLVEAGVVSPPARKPNYEQYQQQQYGGYYAQPQAHPAQQHGGPQFGGPPQQQRGGQHSAYPQQFGAGGYPAGPAATGPSTGAYAPSGGQHAAGPPTPPTGFPAFAPPPGHTSTSGQASTTGGGAHEAPATQQYSARDSGATVSFSAKDAVSKAQALGTSPAGTGDKGSSTGAQGASPASGPEHPDWATSAAPPTVVQPIHAPERSSGSASRESTREQPPTSPSAPPPS